MQRFPRFSSAPSNFFPHSPPPHLTFFPHLFFDVLLVFHPSFLPSSFYFPRMTLFPVFFVLPFRLLPPAPPHLALCFLLNAVPDEGTRGVGEHGVQPGALLPQAGRSRGGGMLLREGERAPARTPLRALGLGLDTPPAGTTSSAVRRASHASSYSPTGLFIYATTAILLQ